MGDSRGYGIWGRFVTAYGMVTAAIWCVVIFLLIPFVGPTRAFFGFGQWWIRQFLRVAGVPWEVRGWEQLPEEIRSGRQPAIFMSSHESLLDPPMLVSAIRVPAVYIAKRELRWMPFIGWTIWAARMIFIDRSNRERALRSMRRAAQQIRAGKSVLIFPEGTRTRDGNLGTFKKGGFHLAQDAGVPIVPLATVGGYQVLPAHSLRVGKGRFRVHFGPVVDTASYADRESLLQAVRERIAALREDALAEERR